MPRYTYDLPDHPIDFGVQVELATLDIDPAAQRTLNPKRAETIANGLIPTALGSLVVSQRRNGKRFVVDGMHRRHACLLAGVPKMSAEVHHGLSQQEEAVLFLLKNRESSKPNALEEFQVGLTAGLPLFLDTQTVLLKHHLTMGNTSNNSIGAVAGTLRVVENYGPDILDRVLTVNEQAWGRCPAAWDGMLIGGVGMFLGRHGDGVDDVALAHKLSKKAATLWIGDVNAMASHGGLAGSGTGSRVQAAYNLVKNAYNRGRRQRIA